MKKYQVSNDRFAGSIELVYVSGVLRSIDFGLCDLKAVGINAFLKSVAGDETQVGICFSQQTRIVSMDFEIQFETFWLKYDHKFNKKRAEALWDRLSKADRVLAFYGVDKYNRFLAKLPERAKLYPDTYIRNKAWENDYK